MLSGDDPKARFETLNTKTYAEQAKWLVNILFDLREVFVIPLDQW